jgi:hypothetical protein
MINHDKPPKRPMVYHGLSWFIMVCSYHGLSWFIMVTKKNSVCSYVLISFVRYNIDGVVFNAPNQLCYHSSWEQSIFQMRFLDRLSTHMIVYPKNPRWPFVGLAESQTQIGRTDGRINKLLVGCAWGSDMIW